MLTFVIYSPQHYASSSQIEMPQDETDAELDLSKDLDDALEESYQSVLEDKSKSVFSENDLSLASGMSPPREKPPAPPGDEQQKMLEEIDRQEKEIIESLQMEEREHKKYMETVQSIKGD